MGKDWMITTGKKIDQSLCQINFLGISLYMYFWFLVLTRRTILVLFESMKTPRRNNESGFLKPQNFDQHPPPVFEELCFDKDKVWTWSQQDDYRPHCHQARIIALILWDHWRRNILKVRTPQVVQGHYRNENEVKSKNEMDPVMIMRKLQHGKLMRLVWGRNIALQTTMYPVLHM